MKQQVLFLCVHNSCRSQMAEAFVNQYAGDRFEAFSAGLEKGVIDPLTVQVMEEIGVDMQGKQSKLVDQFLSKEHLHYLVTVCQKAESHCPTVWPGLLNERLYWPFDDPANAEGTEEERLVVYRRVRDEIKAKVETFLSEH